MVLKKKKKTTNKILSDGKVGIGYARRSLADAILTIKSVRYWVPVSVSVTDAILTIESVRYQVSVSVSDVKSNIESYCHRLPAVTEYPRLNLKSNSSYFKDVKTVK